MYFTCCILLPSYTPLCLFFIFCVDLFFLLPQKFSSQFNIAKMVKLIGRLTGPQKDTVTSCGFGSILSLKCTSIPNALVLWIAKHYDPRVDNSRVLAPHLLRLMQLLSIRSLVFHLEERKSQTNHLVVQSLSFLKIQTSITKLPKLMT